MKGALPMDYDELLVTVADLWFNQDYSPVDIAQELSIPVEQAVKLTETLDRIGKIIRVGMLARVKTALRLDD
jgi:hypothetical protein